MPTKKAVDPELAEFEAALLRSVDQALAGQGRVTTPEQIAKRVSGRPRQAVHKEPVTLRLEPDVLARWRASGKGWQTRMAEALDKALPA